MKTKLTLTSSMRCGLLGGIMAIVAMLAMSPAHASSYVYAVDFSLSNGYSVTGSITSSCDQCLLGPSDVTYWDFNLMGPNNNSPLYTIASLSISGPPPEIKIFAQDPLYALPQGIFFDPLRENQGALVFTDPGNPEAALGFVVFSPDNDGSDIDFVINFYAGNNLLGSDSYDREQNEFLTGGYRIATLMGENNNKYHPREIRHEAQEIAETPLPAALPLFATGLGGLGFLGWRRKRKNTAVIAA